MDGRIPATAVEAVLEAAVDADLTRVVGRGASLTGAAK